MPLFAPKKHGYERKELYRHRERRNQERILLAGNRDNVRNGLRSVGQGVSTSRAFCGAHNSDRCVIGFIVQGEVASQKALNLDRVREGAVLQRQAE